MKNVKVNFQVTETYMTKDGFKVCLSDNESSQSVTFSVEFMDIIIDQWQKFKNGTSEKKIVSSRHYTHEWPDLGWQRYM